MPDVCLNHVYGLCALLGALEVTDCSIFPGKLNLTGIWLRFISLFHWKLWNGTSGPAELKSCVWVLPARLENIHFPLKMFDLKIQFRGGQPDNCTRKLGLPVVFIWSCDSTVISAVELVGFKPSSAAFNAPAVPSGMVCWWLLLEEVRGHFHCFFSPELATIIPANCFLDLKITWRFFRLFWFILCSCTLLLSELQDSSAWDACHTPTIKDSFSPSFILFQPGSAFVCALQSLFDF